MSYVDLGSPVGLVVVGNGATQFAEEIDGNAIPVDPDMYREWYAATKQGQIAPECGALALGASENDATLLVEEP